MSGVAPPMAAAPQEVRDIAQRLLELLAADGFVLTDPPLLQPADIFLERSGEDMRRRSYVFSDMTGRDVCLRPELTIPAVRMVLARGQSLAAQQRISYHGPVFRAGPGVSFEGAQFLQTGAEMLGGAGGAPDDVALLVLAHQGAALAQKPVECRIGDLALFSRLTAQLGLSARVTQRIAKHFWRGDFLTGFERPVADPLAQKSALEALAARLPAEEARALMGDVLRLAGVTIQGTRSLDEIAERFINKARDAEAQTLTPATISLLRTFLSIEGPASRALDAIGTFAQAHRLDLAVPLQAMAARLSLWGGLGHDPDALFFSAHFGRDLEYYSGFVFEIAAGDQVLAGGGRYDGLIESLGGPSGTPATGCAFRTETIAALGHAARGQS